MRFEIMLAGLLWRDCKFRLGNAHGRGRRCGSFGRRIDRANGDPVSLVEVGTGMFLLPVKKPVVCTRGFLNETCEMTSALPEGGMAACGGRLNLIENGFETRGILT